MKKIKAIVWSVLNLTNLGGLVQLKINSYLKEEGWFESFRKKESVDKNGNPIAWCTYPFIHFIYPRLQSHFNVFEYGAGGSTIWYAKKVNKIRSVEHDKLWYEKINSGMPSNSILTYKELVYGGDYSKEVGYGNQKYHIVIVDGRDRSNCLRYAVDFLTDDGVIVFDNSNLKQYQDAISDLLAKGFRKIDFYGMSPIISLKSCTSIIYRDKNCLGI